MHRCLLDSIKKKGNTCQRQHWISGVRPCRWNLCAQTMGKRMEIPVRTNFSRWKTWKLRKPAVPISRTFARWIRSPNTIAPCATVRSNWQPQCAWIMHPFVLSSGRRVNLIAQAILCNVAWIQVLFDGRSERMDGSIYWNLMHNVPERGRAYAQVMPPTSERTIGVLECKEPLQTLQMETQTHRNAVSPLSEERTDRTPKVDVAARVAEAIENNGLPNVTFSTVEHTTTTNRNAWVGLGLLLLLLVIVCLWFAFRWLWIIPACKWKGHLHMAANSLSGVHCQDGGLQWGEFSVFGLECMWVVK